MHRNSFANKISASRKQEETALVRLEPTNCWFIFFDRNFKKDARPAAKLVSFRADSRFYSFFLIMLTPNYYFFWSFTVA